MPANPPVTSSPGRMISPRETEALARRSNEFGNLSPRELAIFFAGVEDGMDIKADEVQPVLSRLEAALNGCMSASAN